MLFIPVISLYGIEEHDIGMIAQKLIHEGYTNPYNLPPDQAESILQKIGIDTVPLEDATRKKFHLPTKKKAEPVASAAQPGGELLKDTPKPEAAPEEEDPDAYHLDDKGDIVPDLPKQAWEISAILVKTRGSFAASSLLYNFQVANTEAQAVNPASVMREFFKTFLSRRLWLCSASRYW